MKITKYEHACLVLEEQGKKLVVDPGSFTSTKFDNLKDVVAIVITHVHGDHLNEGHLNTILKNNPGATILTTQEVATELGDTKTKVVTGGDKATVEPFDLEFFGSQHAVIHESWPVNQNVGVMINNKLYYPGDSFTKPGKPVELLALPVSAPWLKTAEAMDFLSAVKPKKAFPTHNALLSDAGHSLSHSILSDVAKKDGAELISLKPGESTEV